PAHRRDPGYVPASRARRELADLRRVVIAATASFRRFPRGGGERGTRKAPGAGKNNKMREFYRNYLAVVVFIGAAVMMVAAMLGVGRLLRPVRPRPEKLVTYEAGSDPVLGFGQSNVRYYVYALLFVMFDVEAVFVFPWAVRLESLDV